ARHASDSSGVRLLLSAHGHLIETKESQGQKAHKRSHGSLPKVLVRCSPRGQATFNARGPKRRGSSSGSSVVALLPCSLRDRHWGTPPPPSCAESRRSSLRVFRRRVPSRWPMRSDAATNSP